MKAQAIILKEKRNYSHEVIFLKIECENTNVNDTSILNSIKFFFMLPPFIYI